MPASALFLFDEETAGYTYTPVVQLEVNKIWRREVGDTGDGIVIELVEAQGIFRDWKMRKGTRYEWRDEAVGLHGAIRWGAWTDIPIETAPPFVLDGGDAGGTGPDVIDGGSA